MIERLLTSKTRISLIKLLMFNQDKEYHLREISRIIKTSPIYTSKELENLTKFNLVKKEKIANLSIYSINKENIIINELRNIFIKTEYFHEFLKNNIKAKYAFIYGSFAEGTEKDNSDIDLFVISEIKEDELIKTINETEKKTKREINYILWNEKTFLERAKEHHMLKTIKKSRIIMLTGNEDEFRGKIG